MALKVYWTDFAKRELQRVFDYHKKQVSLKIARQITEKIVKKAESLSDFPQMGAVETALDSKSYIFRYVVSTNYKIIYRINDAQNFIEIIDVFDTRQSPVKTTRAIKK